MTRSVAKRACVTCDTLVMRFQSRPQRSSLAHKVKKAKALGSLGSRMNTPRARFPLQLFEGKERLFTVYYLTLLFILYNQEITKLLADINRFNFAALSFPVFVASREGEFERGLIFPGHTWRSTITAMP